MKKLKQLKAVVRITKFKLKNTKGGIIITEDVGGI